LVLSIVVRSGYVRRGVNDSVCECDVCACINRYYNRTQLRGTQQKNERYSINY
jgi:hypothetical protein